MNNVIDFINTHRDQYLDELKSFSPSPASPRSPNTKPTP